MEDEWKLWGISPGRWGSTPKVGAGQSIVGVVEANRLAWVSAGLSRLAQGRHALCGYSLGRNVQVAQL